MMETESGPPPSPWRGIWTRPRSTLRGILDSDPERLVLVLAAVNGVSRALDRASMRSMGDTFPLRILLPAAILGGALAGIVFLYVFGLFIRWTGRWFGGKGSAIEIRAALAWPNVITAVALLLWIPQLLLFGAEIFQSETPRLDAHPIRSLVLMGSFLVLELGLVVWYTVVLLKCVGEAQRFSAWRALGNSIVAGLFLIALILVLIAPFVFIVGTRGR